MRNIKLNFLLIFFLILWFAHQGYADCSWSVKSNTNLESFFAGWGEWRKEIKVIAIKNQEVDGYFNPKIKVCSYGGEEYPEYCHELYKTSCKKIYGTQDTGAGISAMVFIDWEGNKTSANAKIADGLGWEWAEGVTDEEKIKFANSPKICACSQKGACRSGFAKWWDKPFSAIDYRDLCDTCYQTVVKCAPVPLVPGPPPFCEQLAMSPPQVRIVPITNEKNDYFDPKVKVIIGDLIGKDGEIGEKLDFPRKYKKDKAGEIPTPDKVRKHYILDRDGTTHYFKTYRKKNKLCTEYRGTEKEESQRRLQFPARCFPVPPAPEPKVVEVVNEDTLKIEMKMDSDICRKIPGNYSNGVCIFNIDSNEKNIGPLFLKVIKPRIVKKTTKSNNGASKSNIDNIIEDILKNSSRFEILKKYGYVPSAEAECKERNVQGECKLNDLGQPKIEARYNENPKSKMLCLSGWQPEPEEFILKRGNEIISLKSEGVRYIKYNAVYSKESNRFYYLPSKEIVNLLERSQSQLDEMTFNKQGYAFFHDENKQEKGKCSYCVDKDSKIDEAFQSDKGLKVVYKLTDVEHKEVCEQGGDDCICFNETCSRSTQYLNKKGEPFYLRYEEVTCKDKNGKILTNKEDKEQKCIQLKDQLVKANRTEVFYADKLCRLYLENVEKGVLEVIKKRLKNNNPSLSTKLYKFSGNNDYTDDLSQYDYIEIEAWGGGGAGYFEKSNSLPGMPGDYIKAKLKIDPDHPIIRVEVGEGGKQEYNNMNGKSTLVEMCDLHEQNCLPFITVAGGDFRYSGIITKVHVENLKLEENIVRSKGSAANLLKKDKQIAYIEDGKMKYKDVEECREDDVDGAYGAGGCIDKIRGTYSRGFPGYVKISAKKTNYEKIDYERVDKEVEEIIDALVKSPGSDPHVSDLIKKLYPNIIKEIKDEIEKELLG